MPFSCPKCYKVFTRQIQLDKHMIRKSPCIILTKKIPDEHDCIFCGKTYLNPSILNRHIKRCPIQLNAEALVDRLKFITKLALKEKHKNVSNYWKEKYKTKYKMITDNKINEIRDENDKYIRKICGENKIQKCIHMMLKNNKILDELNSFDLIAKK